MGTFLQSRFSTGGTAPFPQTTATRNDRNQQRRDPMMFSSIEPTTRALAAATLLGALVLATPSSAASADAAKATSAALPSAQIMLAQAAPSTPPAGTVTPSKAARLSPTERVEARIKALHANLKITAAQEPQWTTVAQVMRDNAKAIEAISDQRTKNIKTMNAVDDLRSYETLAEAHADGLKKLVAAFQPLYDSMSADQKKNADAVFQAAQQRRTGAKSGAKKASAK